MNLRKYLITTALFAFPIILGAQTDTSKRTLSEAEDMIPRMDMHPRQNFHGANAIDTLDTSRPDMKIILYADNSWYFFRDHSIIEASEDFTGHWDNEHADPYQLNLNDFPLRTTLVLAEGDDDFVCPNKTKVYSRFGYRRGRRHQGVDLPLSTGTPVPAAFAGKVRIAKRFGAYGNLVILRHVNGLETFYGHLSKLNVKEGDWVEAGQIIGLGGSTGRSTGPHLHFETRYKGYAFDPQWLIDFETGELRAKVFVVKRKYLSASSRYVASELQEEIDIYLADSLDYAQERRRFVADSLAAAELAKAQYHTIKNGDTLSKIAVKYNTTVKKILSLNPGMKETTILRIGRKVRVR